MYVGIDVGKKGGIAFLNEEGEVVKCFAMPSIGKDYDLNKMRHILCVHPIEHLVIEDVHSIYGASAKANFSFGEGKGILIGMVAGLGIPFTLVAPKKWQKEMWEGVTKQSSTKKTSEVAVKRLFPHVNLVAPGCRIVHDGIVDAILMGEYCRRKFK